MNKLSSLMFYNDDYEITDYETINNDLDNVKKELFKDIFNIDLNLAISL